MLEKRGGANMRKRFLIISLSVFLLVFSVNSAYAQFWKKWFSKDKQAEEPAPEKEDESAEPQVKEPQAGGLTYSQAEKMVETELKKDIEETRKAREQAAAIPKPDEDRAEAEAYMPQGDTGSLPRVSDEIDEQKTREQMLRTQERIDQISRSQDLNRTQRSLEQIRRINELNRRQGQVNDINRLNRQQQNRDNIRKINETKK